MDSIFASLKSESTWLADVVTGNSINTLPFSRSCSNVSRSTVGSKSSASPILS